MANRRFIDFPIAASVGNNDIVLIWQDGLNKQTTKATLLQGSPQSLAGLTDVDIAGLINGQILQYNSTTSKWENVDRTDIFLSQLGDVTIVAPSNGQVLVYNSSTSKWENSSGGYVPYTGAVTTVNLGAQSILAGSFVKAGGTAAQFLKANGSVDSTAYGTGSVTSVALTMPTAFTVAGSPITTAGTLAVTGAGLVSQYIRGDGSLADFPATTGGGSSVSYYLNGSVSQGTIGGVAYKELNRTPVFGAGTDITINADGYIASFITDALDPNKLIIPAGNWNFETYFSASSNGGTPSFYVELYKYNGTTFTLIASSSTAPELIAFGTSLNPYFSTLAVPETVLALTDRLALRYYVTHSGRTITLHTENGHLCEVITTFTTGLTALNGLTNQVQFFAVGTSGTDFAISSVTDTHTFNLPTASATNRGALSSADWTTFNNKTSNLGTVTSVGLSSATSGVTIGSTPVTTSGTITLAIATASGSQNGLLSSTDWTTFNGKQNALTNPVTGTGTTNYLPKFTGASTIGNSQVFDNGTNVGIGTPLPNTKLEIASGTSVSSEIQRWSYNDASIAYLLKLKQDVSSGLVKHIFDVVNNSTTYLNNLVLTNGNVAIGTTTPTTYSLNGRHFEINDSGGGYSFIHSNTTSVKTFFAANEASLLAALFTFSAHPLTFGTNNQERMRIFSDGNVFIGASPSNGGYKLDVSGTGRITNSAGETLVLSKTSGPSIQFNKSGATVQNWAISTDPNFNVYNYTLGGIPFTISATTNAATFISKVGVGGAAATYSITAYNSSNGTTAAFGGTLRGIRIDNDGTFSSGRSTIYGVDSSFYGSYQPMSIESSSLSLQAVTGGNVMIGTTTDVGYKLDVNGAIRSSDEIYINNGKYLRLQRSSGGLYIQTLGIDSGTDNVRLLTTGDFNILNGSLTSLMTVKNGGFVGIKQTIPLAPLHVSSESSADDVNVQRWDYSTNIAYQLILKQTVTSGVVRWNFSQINNNTTYNNVLVLDRGNVGIGTTTPTTAKLVVSDTSSNKLTITGGSTQNGMTWEATGGANSFYLFNGTISSAGWGLYNINTAAFPLFATNGGNVLIGTTSDSGDKLRVTGTTFTNEIMTLSPESESRSAINWRLGSASIGTIVNNRRLRVKVGGVEYYIGAVEV